MNERRSLDTPEDLGAPPPRRRAVASWLLALAVWVALSLTATGLAGGPLTTPQRLAPLLALYNLALTGAILFLAWTLGRAVWDRLGLRSDTPLTGPTFSIALGLGVLSYVSFFLALGGLLRPPVVATLGLATLACLRPSACAVAGEVRRALRGAREFLTTRGMARWVACFGVFATLSSAVVALMPPFTYDALWYHVAVPQIFVQQHRFVVLPDLGQANFPLGVEMLYALGLLFGATSSPALVHLTFAVLTSAAVWSFAARWGDRRIAWIAAAGFFSASEVTRWAMAADVDLGLTFFQFLSLVALENAIGWRSLRWLALSGALGGLAVAAKYTGGIGLGVEAVLVVVAYGWRPRCVIAGLVRAALLLSIAAAVASPWYVKNAVVWRNPLFPLGSPQYVDPAFGLAEAVGQSAPGATGPLTLLTLPMRVLVGDPTITIAGRGWRDYIALPLNTYRDGDLESHTTPSILFLFAPFALIGVRDPTIRRLMVMAGALSLIWAIGPQELRYLLPAFPVLAVLTGYAMPRLADAAPGAFVGRVALLLTVMMALAVMLITNLEADIAVNPLPVLAGQESVPSFLARSGTDYAAFAYLASTVRPEEHILAIGERRRYYARVPIIYDDTLTLTGHLFNDSVPPAKAAAALRAAGVDYILWYQPDLTWLGQFHVGQVADVQRAFARFRDQYLQQVYASDGGEVYRVKSTIAVR